MVVAGVSTLIVNGGECEPYLSSDDRIMRDFPEMVVDGARLVMYAIGASEALVGIEDNKPEAIAAMRKAAEPYPEVKICQVPTRYPMGSDKQLIQTLTGKEVVLSEGPNVLVGCKLTVQMKSGRAQVDGCPKSGNSGRVQMSITPNKKN